MNKINIKLTTSEAKLLSRVLGAVCWLFKDLHVAGMSVNAIQSLKDVIDEELLKQ